MTLLKRKVNFLRDNFSLDKVKNKRGKVDRTKTKDSKYVPLKHSPDSGKEVSLDRV